MSSHPPEQPPPTRALQGHCPSGSAPGITSGQVKVAASIIDVSSGSLTNATVGVPSTKQQEADYNLVAKKINSEGGAGCRKIVMSFYDVNPVDAANAQQACLSIASAQPYIVLDSGALTEVGASSCIPQHHILLASSYLTPDDLTVYHPYALSIGGNAQAAFRTGILALHQLGYFSAAKGFKKLGVLVPHVRHGNPEPRAIGPRCGESPFQFCGLLQPGMSRRSDGHLCLHGAGGSLVQERQGDGRDRGGSGRLGSLYAGGAATGLQAPLRVHGQRGGCVELHAAPTRPTRPTSTGR